VHEVKKYIAWLCPYERAVLKRGFPIPQLSGIHFGIGDSKSVLNLFAHVEVKDKVLKRFFLLFLSLERIDLKASPAGRQASQNYAKTEESLKRTHVTLFCIFTGDKKRRSSYLPRREDN
jgi:hypothetical protein